LNSYTAGARINNQLREFFLMANAQLALFAIIALLLSGCVSNQPLSPVSMPPASAPAEQGQSGAGANASVQQPASASQAGKPDLGVGADMRGYRPFPAGNSWNQDISSLPVDPLSGAYIATIGEHPLHPDFGTVWNGVPMGIPYVVVSGDSPKTKITFEYSGESDIVLYPIPQNPPIEGGSSSDGDRHILMVDRDNLLLYELYAAYPNSDGTWRAGSGAVFNLSSNALRPAGWTSADAAGLPIFPGLVRYDEVAGQGEVRHALRFTIPKTRKAYVCPARHYASSLTESKYLPMGARLRLKASFDVSGFSKNDQVILNAMKKYGLILADNGGPMFVTGAPDSRWNDEELNALKRVKTSDFEVVLMPLVTVPGGVAYPC
jgi:hypothetical protein